MKKLYIEDAVAFVRSRLDELSQEDSDMLVDTIDDRNLNLTISSLIEEAVESIHLAAPAASMDGYEINEDSEGITASVSDGVLDINLSSFESGILRLISFRAGDNNAPLLNKSFYEGSAIGKLQRSKFMRGTPCRPILVVADGSEGYKPHYLYYTTGLEEPAFSLKYFPKPVIAVEETSEREYCDICDKLELAVLNYLTGMTLETYDKSDKAKSFYDLAQTQL